MKKELEKLYKDSSQNYVKNDPVQFPHRYESQQDIEIVGLLSACMAYGKVTSFIPKIEKILELLGDNPSEAGLMAIKPDLDDFKYRMTKGLDVLHLLRAVQKAQEDHGTLEALYESVEGDTHLERMGNWVHALRSYTNSDARGFKFLLSDPTKGSACKRINLFFRWMVRGPDGVDLGVWGAVKPSELIMPLDTHVVTVAKEIGLTDVSKASMSNALTVTDALKELDQEDPVRYDFALAHTGISDGYSNDFWKMAKEMQDA